MIYREAHRHLLFSHGSQSNAPGAQAWAAVPFAATVPGVRERGGGIGLHVGGNQSREKEATRQGAGAGDC